MGITKAKKLTNKSELYSCLIHYMEVWSNGYYKCFM